MNEKKLPETITLPNGTELVHLDPEVKQKVEREVQEVMDKYQCAYIPVIQKGTSLSEEVTRATIHIYKIHEKKEHKGSEKENRGQKENEEKSSN